MSSNFKHIIYNLRIIASDRPYGFTVWVHWLFMLAPAVYASFQKAFCCFFFSSKENFCLTCVYTLLVDVCTSHSHTQTWFEWLVRLNIIFVQSILAKKPGTQQPFFVWMTHTLKNYVTVTNAEQLTISRRNENERFLIKVRSVLIGAIRLVASHP